MDKQTIFERRLGMIAINKGYATRQEVDRALLEQARLNAEGKHHRFIGDILVNLGILTMALRDELLAIQKDLKKKTANKIQPFAPSNDTNSCRAIDTKITLEVSEDKIEAYISPKTRDYNGVCVDDIKQLLEQEGISYGIISDQEISTYLNQEPISKEPWMVAEGKKSLPMKISEVNFYFANAVTKGQSLVASSVVRVNLNRDLADVKKGDLIAEMFLEEPGSPGVTVYGQAIAVRIPNVVTFQCGHGAKISEDGLKIFSEIDGRPEMISDGRVCVFPIVHISGNVDHETGNFKTNDHIEIDGVIEKDCCIKARSLKVKRIEKATVEVEGDIDVAEGAFGSTINASGKFHAAHIRSATINAVGDVVVDSEVVNSEIHTRGSCIVQKGRILSSTVDAKMGIMAAEIGSSSSRPCALIVGRDYFYQKNFAILKNEIVEEEKEKTRLKNLMVEFQKKAKKVEDILNEATQMESRILSQQIALKNKTEDVCGTDGSAPQAKAEAAIKQLDSQISKIQEKAKTLLDNQEKISAKIVVYQNGIKKSEAQIESLQKKFIKLAEQSKKDMVKPIIDVSGTLFAQTSIQGPKASFICNEDYYNISLKVSEDRLEMTT